jgi:hypothetical protein
VITNKYLAAILNIVAVLFAAVIAAFKSGPLTPSTIDQIVILVIGAIVVYWVPLLNTRWAGLLKVIAAGATAAATALAPYLVTGAIDLGAWLIIGLAILNTLGVGVGVAARTDTGEKA